MKIIDLLNKISNGEEVPDKIKYKGDIYIWGNTSKSYYEQERNYIYVSFDTYELNEEVEVLEEVEDKEYEDIEELSYKYVNTYGNISQHRKSEEPLIVTINALIRNQKYILEQLNKEGNNE